MSYVELSVHHFVRSVDIDDSRSRNTIKILK